VVWASAVREAGSFWTVGVDGEIVVERRRQWTPEEKAALMAEVEAEGGHDDETGVRRVDG